MRDDQKIRLQEVSEKLAEVVIADADPVNWAASGVLLCDMTRDQRGDASWCRKTAVQSIALLTSLERLLKDEVKGEDPDDTEEQIKRAERAAEKALRGVLEK